LLEHHVAKVAHVFRLFTVAADVDLAGAICHQRPLDHGAVEKEWAPDQAATPGRSPRRWTSIDDKSVKHRLPLTRFGIQARRSTWSKVGVQNSGNCHGIAKSGRLFAPTPMIGKWVKIIDLDKKSTGPVCF
jgi:hypothetical protein